jgi:opacity protein-like surface antigen
MRLIKSSAIAALVLSAASIFAGSATPHHPHHIQAHAGYGKLIYGLGYGMGQNNSTLNTISQNTTTSALVTGGTSFQGFGFVGYEAELSECYKASIQSDLGYDSLNKTVSSTTSQTMKIKSGFNYGLSARAGMVHGDFSPYLLAGLRIGQWSESISSPLVSAKKTLVAPELGAGIQFVLSDKVDGRMEYKYFFGGNINVVNGTNTYTLKARQQSAQFSLVF